MGIAPFTPKPEPEEEAEEWVEPDTEPAEELTYRDPADLPTRERDRKIRSAMIWLRSVMGDGQARPAAEIQELATGAGIARATLTVARQRCHIKSERLRDNWLWTPPRSWKQATVTRKS